MLSRLFVNRVCSSLSLGFTLVILVLSGVGYAQNGPTAGGNPLRYRWQQGASIGYAVDISVDLPDAVQTYKGTIAYTLNGMEGDLLKLTYDGGLNKSETRKQNATGGGGFGDSPFFGPPAAPPGPFARNPFMGLERTTNVILVTPRGEVRGLEGSSQLPFLLGNLSLLVLEPLPDANETSWRGDKGVTVTEKDDDDRREPSFSPFAKPKTEKRTAATSVTSYTVGQTQGNLVIVNKTFEMKSGADQNFSIVGNGKWTFNRNLGAPEGLDFQQKLIVNVNNVSINVPMTIKYRRYDDAEWKKLQEDTRLAQEKAKREAAEAKAQADAKAKADAIIPLTAKEKQSLMADIKSGDFWRMKNALDKLAGKEPKEPDNKLGEVILPATKNGNNMIRNAAFAALKKWSPELHVTAALNYHYFSAYDTVDPSNRPLTADTPLPVGLIVCARSQNGWRGAEIRGDGTNGKVKVRYSGNNPGWDIEVNRADLQLAPPEIDQPNLDKKALALVYGKGRTSSAKTSGFRTWKDSTGSFSIEAEFLGVTDGKVRLRRKDGQEIGVPLSRLSKADQQEAKKLEGSASTANPFEPASP